METVRVYLGKILDRFMLHVIFDVTQKFRSRYLARALENNASDKRLMSKFGVLRQFVNLSNDHPFSTPSFTLASIENTE